MPKEVERWITVNGVRVPIFKDGSIGGPKALQDKIKSSAGGKKEPKLKSKKDNYKKQGPYTTLKSEDGREYAYVETKDGYEYGTLTELGHFVRQGKVDSEEEARKMVDDSVKTHESKGTISKQINNDFDKKEKQIAQNKAEKDKLNGKSETAYKEELDRTAKEMIKNEQFSALGKYMADHRKDFHLTKTEDAYMAAYHVIKGERELYGKKPKSQDKPATSKSEKSEKSQGFVAPGVRFGQEPDVDSYGRWVQMAEQARQKRIKEGIKKNFGSTIKAAKQEISNYSISDLKEVAEKCGFTYKEISKMSDQELKTAILAIYKRK